jgi:hypothetical protein
VRAVHLLVDGVFVAGLLGLTWWLGVRSTDFVGVPKGSDALDHASTTELLLRSFPHVLWTPAWFEGVRSVPGIYPPLYALIMAAAVTVAKTSIEHAMVVGTAVAYLVMTASMYGFVRIMTKSRVAAVLAGLLALGAPALWSQSLQVGEYPRLFGMAFGYLATFLAAWYTAKPGRLRLGAVVLAATCGMATHDLTGGLGVVQVLGVLLLVPYRPLPQRARAAVGVAAAVTGLAMWLYLPTLIGSHAYYILPQARFVPSTGTAFGRLFHPVSHSLKTLSPALVPLTVVAMGIALWILRRRPSLVGPRFRWAVGAAAAMMIVVVCVLAYAYVGRVVHADLEVVGIYPSDMLAYAAWPMAATCGLLLAVVCSAMRGRWVRWRRAGVAVVPVAASVACLVAVGPVLARNALAYEQAAAVEAPRMPGSDGTQQYRIALTDTTESSWISHLTRVPELGGPFNQGAIDLDWANWAQSVLSNSPPSAAEAEFIAQWNAVRWVEAGPFPSAYGFYQDHPGVFEDLGPSTYPAFHTYLVRRTSPILAATDAPPVLVIGPYEDDNLLLRSLAVTDVGPNHMIPVEGPANLDDYTLAELEQFPEIFLYGFEAGDPVRDAQLLERYVAHGGGLVVDAGGDAALTAQLADDGAPLPVTSWGSLELLDAWHFRPSTSPLVRGIDLAGFAPAVYAGTDPYLVEAARQRVAGSAVALASGDHPVLVDERLGRGLVVESGLNLPYHDAVFSNVAESDLLARMIALAMAPGWVHATPASGIASMAPDSDSLRVGSADGVLFKEADTPGWHVSVDGRAATVLPAGPGLMYVRLDPSAGPADVVFRYQLSTVEWGGIGVAVVTTLLLLAYLAGARLPRRVRRRLDRLRRRLAQRLWPRTTAVRTQRATLQRLLPDPSPRVRQDAVAMLRHEDALQPYGDLLLARVHEEDDPQCVAELVRLVAAFQWEPLASSSTAELRQWARTVLDGALAHAGAGVGGDDGAAARRVR